MFGVKCLLFLAVFVYIEADGISNYESPVDHCDMYHFTHGRVRWRQRYKLARFLCYPRYTLVGNRYVACVNGQWDGPWPVCVRPGCTVPKIENALQVMRHYDAWMTIFCLPGYELNGPSVMYCDGWHWNGTYPTCVRTASESQLSCDFEDPNLCGWKQDELHDFDWKRLNLKTPSSFLLTGPSYDHTFGKGGTGYYMYIESTSRLENDTARLLSPVYSQALIKDGCFSFFYHMLGAYIGGLRVYQKPDSLALERLLKLSESSKEQYILFEQWGNQGDVWYGAVSALKNQSEDFQIVIEGIRGRSFTSDIAIDDVAILHGDNCTSAKNQAPTPTTFLSESCNGRCDVFGTATLERGCGCTASCVTSGNCCPDFFELCVFDADTPTTEDDKASTGELPQTEKLVASNTTQPESTTNKTTDEHRSTIPNTPVTNATTIKPTTKLTTTKKLTTTTKPTTTMKITRPTTLKTTTVLTTRTTTVKPTTIIVKPVKTTTKTILTTTTRPKITTKQTTKTLPVVTTTKAVTIDGDGDGHVLSKIVETQKGQSGGLKTGLLIMALLVCCVGALWVVYAARGARGRLILDRLRGRAQQDPEVRYLHADTDDE